MSTKKALLEEFAHETTITRRVLEVVPEEHLTWQLYPGSMTLARLAGHVAEIPAWTQVIMERQELDLAAGSFSTTLEPSRLSELLVGFGSHVGDFHAALAQATDEDLAAAWTLRRGAGC